MNIKSMKIECEFEFYNESNNLWLNVYPERGETISSYSCEELLNINNEHYMTPTKM